MPKARTLRLELAKCLGYFVRGCKQIVTNRRAVRMHSAQVPAALLVCTASYVTFLIGSFTTLLFPGWMQERFQV